MSSEKIVEFIEVLDLVLKEKHSLSLELVSNSTYEVLGFDSGHTTINFIFRRSLRNLYELKLLMGYNIFYSLELHSSQINDFALDDYALINNITYSINSALKGIELDEGSEVIKIESNGKVGLGGTPKAEMDVWSAENGYAYYDGSDWNFLPEVSNDEDLVEEWVNDEEGLDE